MAAQRRKDCTVKLPPKAKPKKTIFTSAQVIAAEELVTHIMRKPDEPKTKGYIV